MFLNFAGIDAIYEIENHLFKDSEFILSLEPTEEETIYIPEKFSKIEIKGFIIFLNILEPEIMEHEHNKIIGFKLFVSIHYELDKKSKDLKNIIKYFKLEKVYRDYLNELYKKIVVKFTDGDKIFKFNLDFGNTQLFIKNENHNFLKPFKIDFDSKDEKYSFYLLLKIIEIHKKNPEKAYSWYRDYYLETEEIDINLVKKKLEELGIKNLYDSFLEKYYEEGCYERCYDEWEDFNENEIQNIPYSYERVLKFFEKESY